jgi:hypothetical protein
MKIPSMVSTNSFYLQVHYLSLYDDDNDNSDDNVDGGDDDNGDDDDNGE